MSVVADVTKQDQVRTMIKETVDKLGPLTIMVANAGKFVVVDVVAFLSFFGEGKGS